MTWKEKQSEQRPDPGGSHAGHRSVAAGVVHYIQAPLAAVYPEEGMPFCNLSAQRDMSWLGHGGVWIFFFYSRGNHNAFEAGEGCHLVSFLESSA